MKRIKILSFVIIIFLLIGLCKVNLNLNRQIYMSIASDISNEDLYYNNGRNRWNLDHMIEVFSYPSKYDIVDINGKKSTKEDEITIPRIRILFSAKPFDFRIDTKKYVFYINSRIMSNFKSKLHSTSESMKDSTIIFFKNICSKFL
ncbi:hypothetical protein [Clostridium sp.]|jgi:hypothetical protein|uniref:hypothetical protein n=1 Tax=Clostridium sp. TaxID=1506 RepID=UPI0039F52704